MKLRNMKRGEDTEQMKVMYWAAAAVERYPDLRWLFHIPNGGSRNSQEAINLKKMGVKRGVSDLCLPYAHGCYHGLYIEMKYGRNIATQEQKEFLLDMSNAGHCVAVCHDAQAAIALIEHYMNLAHRERLHTTQLDEQNVYWDTEHICHLETVY